MSHIVSISVEIRDVAALQAACRRNGLEQPIHGNHHLFDGNKIGHAVKLPGWNYPVVCDVATGTVHYDNFGGSWGEQKHLDRLVQAFAVEKAKLEARKRNQRVTEQTLPDGSIRLVVQA